MSLWPLKGPFGSEACCLQMVFGRLTTESVEGSALSLERIDDVHGGDGLPLGVLGVGDGITDDVFQEHLQDTTGLFVDEARDTLDTTTTSQTANGGLGNTLDVIAKYLSVTLGASLAEALSSFTTSRHVELRYLVELSLSGPNVYALAPPHRRCGRDGPVVRRAPLPTHGSYLSRP